MLLTWIFGGVAVGAIVVAITQIKKNRKLTESLRSALKSEQYALNKLYSLESGEWVLTKFISSNYPEIHVIMLDPEWENGISVKKFEYDPNDPEDRDFAIRQAEELIEIINKF